MLLLMEPLCGSVVLPNIASYDWWNTSGVHYLCNRSHVLVLSPILYPMIGGTPPAFIIYATAPPFWYYPQCCILWLVEHLRCSLLMEPLRGSGILPNITCYYWWNTSGVHYLWNRPSVYFRKHCKFALRSIYNRGAVTQIIE
jgi:hypothetical protein